MEDIIQEKISADHLLYVSLKYTRTVDVFKNIIERYINSYDQCMLSLLKKAHEQKKVASIPDRPLEMAALVKTVYKDYPAVFEAMEEYLLLRKINKAEYTKAREFRRHVTMTAMVDGEMMDLTIDRMHEMYDKLKNFIQVVEELLNL